MKLATLILVVPVLLTLSRCGNQRSVSIKVTDSNEITLSAWEKFVSPDGSFTILYPGKPVESEYSIESPVGMLDVRSYKFVGLASYFVSYTDYPTSIDKPATKDLILDHARESGVKGVNGRLVSESNSSLRGYPGRLLVVESPNGGPNGSVIRNNVYLVGNRLYSMQVAIRKDNQSSKESRGLEGAAAKFLDSFDLSHGKP